MRTSRPRFPAGGYHRAANQFALRFLAGAILPTCVIIMWQLISSSFPAALDVVSSPSRIASSLINSVGTKQLWLDIGSSLLRAIGGWAMASLIAAPTGVMMARNRFVRNIIGPVLNLMRPISPVAWIPIAILWFGIGYGSKFFIVGLISFFVVLANSFQSAASIDPKLLKAARTFTSSAWLTFIYVILPASARGIIIGAQFALASAWGGVIIAEYTGATNGVGYQMLHAANQFLPTKVMMYMVVIAVIGYLLNLFVKAAMNTRLGKKYSA